MRSRLDAAISEEEQSGAIRALPGSQQRSTFRSGLVIALAAVAVIIPATLFWDRSASEQPGPIPVAAEPPAPARSPGTTALRSVAWASTELPDFIESLTVHDGRFYAVSSEDVLLSHNGVDWTVAGHLPPGSHVGDLVSHGDLLVANGAEITEDAAEGRASTPKIFASADDGKTWSVAMVGEFVVSVVSTPNGLIAPGWIDLSPIGDQLPRKAAVWTSENGLDWTLAWEAEADVTSSSVATNAIWDDGLVVLGGQGPANYSEGSGTSGPAWDRVVWAGPSVTELSANGSTNILGNVEDLKSTSLGHFALTHSVDRSAKDSSAIWRSDDGITWTSANVGVGWYHSSIATDGSTIIIAGDTLGYAPDPEVRIWYTLDGGTWTEYDTSAIPKGLRVKSVELHDGVLVAALYSNDEIGGYLMSTRID